VRFDLEGGSLKDRQSVTVDKAPHCKNGHEMMIKTAKAIRAATITVKLNFRIRRS
jgi:hypothetical protein